MASVVTFYQVNQGLFLCKIVFKLLCKYQLRRRHLFCFRPFCKTIVSSNSTIFQVRPTCDNWILSSFFEFTIAGSGLFNSIVSIIMSFVPFVVISTSSSSSLILMSSRLSRNKAFKRICSILMLEVCPASSDSYQ